MAFDEFSVPELVDLCKQSMRQYRRGVQNDPRFCYELFRRGLHDGQEDALKEVMEISAAFALNAVYRHTGLHETGEPAEYFATEAARRLYRYKHGEAFDTMQTYPDILAYLNKCAMTAIGEVLRKRRAKPDSPPKPTADNPNNPDSGGAGGNDPEAAAPPPKKGAVISTTSLDDDPRIEDDSAAMLDLIAVWDRVCKLLPNENDQILVRALTQELAPRHIVELFPDRWADAAAVSRALSRIRDILRNDPLLRKWAGIDKDD